MKGIVFSEFVEMVETQFGVTVADHVLTQAELASGGAYTSVGSYDHVEMLNMVTVLSQKTGIPVPNLARAFGAYLFKRFTVMYPSLFVGLDNALDMLMRIDGYIHMEVRKLYNDAELPRIFCETSEDGSVVLTYRSARPFADLAEGLIQGCIDHFNEKIEITRQRDEATDGRHAVFVLRRVAELATP